VLPVDVAVSYFDWQGRPVLLGAVRDNSRRRRLEQEIAHLATFPAQHPSPVIEVSMDGRVRFANPAAMAAIARLGLDSDARQFLPGTPEELAQLHSDCEVQPQTRELRLGSSTFIINVSAPEEDTLRVFATDITDHMWKEK
jgi:hypothetical protein